MNLKEVFDQLIVFIGTVYLLYFFFLYIIITIRGIWKTSRSTWTSRIHISKHIFDLLIKTRRSVEGKQAWCLEDQLSGCNMH